MKKAMLLCGLCVALVALVAASTYNTPIYTEQGGARRVIGSGGTLDVESGGEIDIESGGALKFAGTEMTADGADLNLLDGSVAGTIVASKAIVADSNGALADADLLLDSTNEINLTIGAVSLLALDDAAISGNVAAADTAGKAVYVESQDGGVDTAVDGGSAGAAVSFKGGDGSAGGADQDGAAGGAYTIVAGAGSAGGAHTANDPDGGDGADVILTSGAGGAAGAAGSGVAGDPGKVDITAGCLYFTDAQTLDMADAQAVLTLNPGTPVGTTITSNVLFVDPNSTGGTEDLLLPPEGDCNGLTLFIVNTAGGAEAIVVKEDGDSTTIATIDQNEVAYVVCDGTTWRGGISPQS